MEPKYTFTALRQDSSESIFFARELTAVRAKAYNVMFPELKARRLIPVGDAGMSPGDEIGIYEQYTQVGVAEFVSNYATDFPRAAVKGAEFSYKVKSLGSSYDYNVQEVRAAARAGKPLNQMRADAARRAIELKIESIALSGDSVVGLLGLKNQTNALDYAVPNGAAVSPLWTLKTADEILLDMFGMEQKISQTTKDVEFADTLLLPQSSYELIRTKRANTFSDASVLDVFLKMSKTIKTVEGWYQLETAAPGGGRLAIAYRNSPDHLMLIIPQEFEQFPPQTVGMVSKTHCHARTGGVVATIPLSICYADLF
jgi:hypothetical protein